jgi:hypothetical protein
MCLSATAVSADAQPLQSVEYEARFTIAVPADWETLHDMGQTRIVALVPESVDATEFRPNINVVIDGLAALMSEDEYWEYNEAQMGQMLSGFRTISTASAELAGAPAMRNVYEYQLGDETMHVLIYGMVGTERAYLISGTATKDRFAEFEPLFEQIIQSFMIR